MADDCGGGTHSGISGGSQLGPVLQGRDFRNVQIVTNQAAAAPVSLAQLPPPVVSFTGRGSELALMMRLLDPTAVETAVVVSAAGLAGVGKTALAVHAAHAAQDRGWFQGGILFIDLHGYDETPTEPAQALDTLLRAFGAAAEQIPPDVEARAGLYRSLLAYITEPVLVIADNASSEAQVLPLLPGAGRNRIVITSRHTLAALDARLLDVKILNDSAGLKLLDRVLRTARPDDSRISRDREAAARLARICGGLPLALQIVAALLKADPALSVGELTDELDVEQVRLERLRYDDGSGARAPSVAAAFELSYRTLDEISARVFRALSVNPGPDLSTDVAAILADLPVNQTRKVLGGLARAHLIEAAPTGAVRWHMHDLIRLYGQRLVAAHDARSLEGTRDRLLMYYLVTADAAYDHLNALPGAQTPRNFTGREQALAWFEAERHNLVGSVSMAAATGRTEMTVHLANRVTVFLSWRRYFDELMTVCTMGLKAARRLLNRQWEGMALMDLNVALQGMRRFEEAITVCQDAATIFREIGDREREAKVLAHLAVAFNDTRRPREAIAVSQKAITILQESGDQQDEALATVNLANGLQEDGKFKEAISAYQRARRIFHDIGDLYGEGLALGNLGLTLQKVQRFAESVSVCKKAVALYQESGNRHSEATALYNLSVALRGLRRFDEAVAASRDALTIFRETSDRHGEGIALTILGSVLPATGQFDEAVAAGREAVTIFRETGDRYQEGRALESLGSVLRIGQFDEAIAAYQEAITISREAGDRRGEGTALNNLGLTLVQVRRFEEAITAHQDAAAIFRETGDRHSEGIALNNLELDRTEQNREAEEQ